MTPGACWAYEMCAIAMNTTHTSAPLKPMALPPAVREYGLKELPTQGHGPVPAQPLVDKRHDFIERVRLQPLLLGDAPDQAVYAFDILGPGKEGQSCRRGFTKTFGGLRVLFKRHQVFVLCAKSAAQLRNLFIVRARLRRIAVRRLFDGNHLL